MYDVIGSVAGRVQYFGRGMGLEQANALSALLTAEGIGGTRDEDGGFQGDIQNAQTVSDLVVTRSSQTAEAVTTETGENFTLTAANSGLGGLWYFTPAESVEALGTITPSVTGDFTANLTKEGVIEVWSENLTITDTLSAVYTYKAVDDVQAGETTLVEDTDLDGVAYIFEMDEKYDAGSLTITTEVTGTVFLVEGGANLIELWTGTKDARTPFPSGSGDIVCSYDYSSGDQ